MTWKGTASKSFNIMQGDPVKQGGILSPFLYTLYVNDLLSELNSSGLGACVGDVFVGSPMYADNLALAAATASARPARYAQHRP